MSCFLSEVIKQLCDIFKINILLEMCSLLLTLVLCRQFLFLVSFCQLPYVPMFALQHEADGPSNFCKYHLSYSDLTEALFANTDK